MDAQRLPGAPTRDGDRIVAHVDVDCFYASCERLREPALEDEPLVVGMGFEPGETVGAVATASYEAREYGVESAMAISEALDRLPRKVDAVDDPDLDVEDAGFYRPVDMAYYQSIGEDVREILHDRADVVREVSIDEAYLDVTERLEWDAVDAWAAELKSTIEKSVGVVASVGVAPTMSAAKVASDHDKPDGLVIVHPGDVRGFFAPLPIDAVHGIGPVTAGELNDLGIETAGDLADADPDVLEERFGDRGLEVRRYARGEDDRDVTPRGKPKSLSRETALGNRTDDAAFVRERIRTLAGGVAERASRKDALYQTIEIKIVTPPFDVNTRAQSLPGPVDDPALVEDVALDLYEAEFTDARVRKVGVRVSNLAFDDADQSSLTGWDGADALPSVDDVEPIDPEQNRAASTDLPLGQSTLSDFSGAEVSGDAERDEAETDRASSERTTGASKAMNSDRATRNGPGPSITDYVRTD